MKNSILYFVVIIWFQSALSVFSQVAVINGQIPEFDKINTDNGLSDASVCAILQDSTDL